MPWIFAALLEPIFHGGANVLDEYFTNKFFKNPVTLIFFSSLINILFLPIIMLVQRPEMPSGTAMFWFAVIGAIDIAYLYPYLKALQVEETSVVTSLFSLEKLFIPALAFIFVQESLTMTQYLGFAIIILSDLALAAHTHGRVRFDRRAFLYMTICSFLIASQLVIYKFTFETERWSTAFVWGTLWTFALTLPAVFFAKQRRAIVAHLQNLRHTGPLFALEEMFTFLGSAGSTYAIALAPVTLVAGISSLQPIAVLLYAVAFKRALPGVFKEKVSRKSIMKKLILFAILIVGVVLVV